MQSSLVEAAGFCAIAAVGLHLIADRAREIIFNDDDGEAAISRFVVLAVVSSLKSAATIAAISYLSILIYLWAWRLATGPATVEALLVSIGHLDEIKTILSGTLEVLGRGVAVVITVAFVVWARARARRFAERLVFMGLQSQPDLQNLRKLLSEPPSGPLETFLTVLTSKGLLQLFKKPSKHLGLAATSLMFLSLVGAESAGVVEAKIVHLDRLKVHASHAEALTTWEKLKDEPADQEEEPDRPESKDDDAELDATSAIIAREVEWAMLLELPTRRLKPADAFKLKRAAVRKGILSSFSASSPGKFGARLNPSLSEARDLLEEQKSAFEFVERAVTTNGPMTRLGERLRTDVRRELKETQATTRERIVETVQRQAEAFTEPLQLLDIGKKVAADLLDSQFKDAIDAVVGKGGDALTNVLKKAIHKGAATGVTRYYETILAKTLYRIAEGDGARAAVDKAIKEELRRPVLTRLERQALYEESTRTVEEKMPKPHTLVRVLFFQQPTLAEVTPSSMLPKNVGDLSPAAWREKAASMITYADLFPGQLGEETRTARARLLRQRDKIRGETDRSVKPHSDADSQAAKNARGQMTQAFDFTRVSTLSKVGRKPKPRPSSGTGGFKTSPTGRIRPTDAQMRAAKEKRAEKLRSIRVELGRIGDLQPAVKAVFGSSNFVLAGRFAKVAGVVIGRTGGPPARPLDYVDLAWRDDGRDLRLSLTRRDREVITLPPYRREIALLALAYAADGRPVAVTMIRSGEGDRLKVLLHPALLNRPLGNRLIQLDSLVDRYLEPTLKNAVVEDVASQIALYEVARLEYLHGVILETLAVFDSKVNEFKRDAYAVTDRGYEDCLKLFDTLIPLDTWRERDCDVERTKEKSKVDDAAYAAIHDLNNSP